MKVFKKRIVQLILAFILGFAVATTWIYIVQELKEKNRIERGKAHAELIEKHLKYLYERFSNYQGNIMNLSDNSVIGEIQFKTTDSTKGEAICSISFNEITVKDYYGNEFQFENQSFINVEMQLFNGRECSYYVSDRIDDYRITISFFGNYRRYGISKMDGEPYLIAIIPEHTFRRYSLYQGNIENELGKSMRFFKTAGYIYIE